MRAAYQFLKKQGVSISFAIGALLSIISLAVIIVGFPEGATMEELHATTIFNPALNITYILMFVAALAAIVGPAIYTALNFKDSVQFLIIFVALLVMYFISIAMGASPNAEQLAFFQGVDNSHLTADIIKYIDGLLIFTGIIMFLTLCSLVFMGVWGMLKQR
jgi:hypothetical protein